MNKTNILIIFYLLLNIFLLINSFVDEGTSMKVFACLNIIEKKFPGGEENKPSIYSPVMLACFIKITDDQRDKILNQFGQGTISLNDDEIDDLTNVESLKYIPENQLSEKSILLEQIIKEFQQFDEDLTKMKDSKNISDKDFMSNSYNKNTMDKMKDLMNMKNEEGNKFFSFDFMEPILDIFSYKHFWLIIFFLVVLFFFIVLIISTSDLDKPNPIKDNDNKEKKENNGEKEKEKERKDKPKDD